MFDKEARAPRDGGDMGEYLRCGSCEGIGLRGLTLGQKVLSVVLACVVAVVLVVLPNVL